VNSFMFTNLIRIQELSIFVDEFSDPSKLICHGLMNYFMFLALQNYAVNLRKSHRENRGFEVLSKKIENRGEVRNNFDDSYNIEYFDSF